MTTPAGPPCDLCEAEAAVESVMNLAEMSQVLIGPNCLLTFHAGMAEALRGAAAGSAPEDQAAAPGAAGGEAAPEAAQQAAEAPPAGPPGRRPPRSRQAAQ